MKTRLFSTLRCLRSHDNPLGLPQKKPPSKLDLTRGIPQQRSIRHVKKVIAVSSAKGGVGKSTIAANLALAFTRQGYRTGLLDTDLHGPSIPTLMNLSTAGPPRTDSNDNLIPITNYGLSTMSMGYLIPETSPVVWRGLMLNKALSQLLHQVSWGPSMLDCLVIDLPPGTGDIPLSISQQIRLDGVVIVTTPQHLSLSDAVRGVSMFRALPEDKRPRVLGMVLNMSTYVCSGCGEAHRVFGSEKVVREKTRELGLEVLAEVPLHGSISANADEGRPTVVADPGGAEARMFLALAEKVGGMVGVGE
ncbi:nucleotide binding protein-like protein [Aulographum hederae CBS 113979]|uniref:Nucleotide binding protein-like protein n=1 Tax=Aulographum hederae CBS 113979 TaxID=1176131 RepID=A0A6G1GL93_9PEZI|nr:nucleotide binding protein-like protein [Aulographum hederae CBS 113979]